MAFLMGHEFEPLLTNSSLIRMIQCRFIVVSSVMEIRNRHTGLEVSHEFQGITLNAAEEAWATQGLIPERGVSCIQGCYLGEREGCWWNTNETISSFDGKHSLVAGPKGLWFESMLLLPHTSIIIQLVACPPARYCPLQQWRRLWWRYLD
jgi:hypothetical protein